MGQHRLEAAALGLPASVSAPELPSVTPAAELAGAKAPVPAQVASPLPTSVPVVVAPAARLSVVAVPASPDPLVDTMPHPIVKMFPLPVAAAVPLPGEAAEQEVFADLDTERDQQATAELAAGADPQPADYHGRHTA